MDDICLNHRIEHMLYKLDSKYSSEFHSMTIEEKKEAILSDSKFNDALRYSDVKMRENHGVIYGGGMWHIVDKEKLFITIMAHDNNV